MRRATGTRLSRCWPLTQSEAVCKNRLAKRSKRPWYDIASSVIAASLLNTPFRPRHSSDSSSRAASSGRGPAFASESANQRLSRLFLSEASFVARSMRRLGVPPHDIEDAVHEVFLTTASKLADLPVDASKERAFLFGVARRHAANVRRSLKKGAARSDFDSPIPAAAADDFLDERRARATLDGILDTMAFANRTVFVLFELQEMTMQQIADMLNLPLGTVASRLKRARATFEEAVARIHEEQRLRPTASVANELRGNRGL